MRRSTLLSLIGWLIALAAVCASFVLLWELQTTRAALRLETVRLPVTATRLPEDWTTSRYRVLLVGDSRIRQWGVLPAAEGIAFAKSGVGGETTGQLQDRFKRDVLDISPRPDEIVLAIGINDLVAASIQTRRVEAIHARVSELMLERIQDLADLARAQGIKVRLATIIQPAAPDMTRRLLFWDDSLYRLVSDANARINALGYPVIDFNAILEGGDGPLPDRFSFDTLHFNAAAYDTLSNALIREFASR